VLKINDNVIFVIMPFKLCPTWFPSEYQLEVKSAYRLPRYGLD